MFKLLLCLILSLALALGMVAIAAGQALACCMYNKAKYEIQLGTSFGGEWNIAPSNKRCDPGKGGVAQLNVWNSLHTFLWPTLCSVPVDKHGWIEVTQDGKKFTITSYHKDGGKDQQCDHTLHDLH